jgi:hypothetical protein
MKRIVLVLMTVLATMLGSLSLADTAHAQPVAAFQYAPSVVRVGREITFNGGYSTCDVGKTCTYTWSWTYRTSGGRVLTGGQMGSGKVIRYTFGTFAASKPFVTVKLKVTVSGPTNNFSIATKSFVVLPAL